MDIRFFRREHITALPPQMVVAPRDEMPFFMTGEFPETVLNRWLFSLPRRGCESPRTWTNYANYIKPWVEFLARAGHGYLDDPTELRDLFMEYRQARLNGSDPAMPASISAASWNTELAGIGNFYDWANAEQILSGYPYDKKTATIRRPDGGRQTVQVNLARARTGRKNATIRYLTPEFRDFFISVGLAGNLPDGRPDPAFTGRNRVRNATLGKMLFSTGLRISELLNLLVWEVPKGKYNSTDHVPFDLPSKITKGLVARTTCIDGSVLDSINGFISLERAIQTSQSTWAPDEPLVVTDPSSANGRVGGRIRKWATVTIGERQRLMEPSGSSAILFVGEGGKPLSADSVQKMFTNASKRCQEFNPNFPDVHPHMARHTFAVTSLRRLIRQSIITLDRLDRGLGNDARALAHRVSVDPLLVVRDMLGHSSVATTQIYLSIIDPEAILSEEEQALLMEQAIEAGDFDD